MLHWQCSSARGKIATSTPIEVKVIPRMPKTQGLQCNRKLARLLELGALSCHNSALASIGLNGMVMLYDDGRLWCLSSDDVTIAAANMDCPEQFELRGRITLGPGEADLLATLSARTGGTIGFIENSVLYEDAAIRAAVHVVPPLRHDLWALASNYCTDDSVMPLPRDKVAAFVKRVSYLAETKQRCDVTLHAADDRLTLQFVENVAQTEEFYLIDGFQVPEPCQVTVDALKLGRALSHCDELVLDHMQRKLLTFRAKDGSFYYMISGREEAKA